MSFQTLAFLLFLAVTAAVCPAVGRRNRRAGAGVLTAACAIFYLLGPGGWRTAAGGLVCLLLGIGVSALALRAMAGDTAQKVKEMHGGQSIPFPPFQRHSRISGMSWP